MPLSLVLCLFVGIPSQAWRWFWAAGVVAAAYALLNPLLVSFDGRILGLFGWPTFSATWLTLALLWSLIGIMRDAKGRLEWTVYGSGAALMLVALISLGARAAFLSFGGGAITAALIAVAVSPRRLQILRLSLGVLLSVVVLLGLFYIVPSNWRPKVNLLTRFQLNDPFRQDLWMDVQAIVPAYPTVLDYTGHPDDHSGLRQWLGYGLEMFEVPHRLVTTHTNEVNLELRVDRAHNDWLDTLVSLGVMGLIARLSLLASVLYGALKRLGLWQPILPLWILLVTEIVALWAQNTPYQPVFMTLASIGAFWIWLIYRILWSPVSSLERVLDWNAWVAVVVLIAHVIDMQFGFSTVATTLPAWLAFGLLVSHVEKIDMTSSQLSIL